VSASNGKTVVAVQPPGDQDDEVQDDVATAAGFDAYMRARGKTPVTHRE
jgi:hypothetical protein